jgi:hypothetical protein
MTLTTLALVVLSVRPTAAQHGGHLLVADGDGTVRAWTAKDLAFDAALTKRLNGDGLLAIAADGETLWGFDGTRAFTWDDAGQQWDRAPSKKAPPAPCTAFAVVGGAPVGTCGPGVFRFTDGTSWDAPEFKDQVRGRGFGEAPSAVASHGTQLAIAVGFGEWGGYFWLLDVATGAWSKHYDSLAYPTGMTWTGSAWAVAWSMSHFDASTRVRLHAPDASLAKEGERVRGRYLRALAWDAETKALVALEQQALVRVDEKLAFTKVQDIGKVAYGPERHAIGVSSGIGAFLALGGGRVLIVPVSGEALVGGGGKVTALRAPTTDAGPKN